MMKTTNKFFYIILSANIFLFFENSVNSVPFFPHHIAPSSLFSHSRKNNYPNVIKWTKALSDNVEIQWNQNQIRMIAEILDEICHPEYDDASFRSGVKRFRSFTGLWGGIYIQRKTFTKGLLHWMIHRTTDPVLFIRTFLDFVKAGKKITKNNNMTDILWLLHRINFDRLLEKLEFLKDNPSDFRVFTGKFWNTLQPLYTNQSQKRSNTSAAA